LTHRQQGNINRTTNIIGGLNICWATKDALSKNTMKSDFIRVVLNIKYKDLHNLMGAGQASIKLKESIAAVSYTAGK
jgi:hypothetical protein